MFLGRISYFWSALPLLAAAAMAAPAASAACPNCLGSMNLPTEKIAIEPVPAPDRTAAAAGGAGYFTATVSGAYGDIANGTYAGWCADYYYAASGRYSGIPYSTYGVMPAGSASAAWPQVNYILNHKSGTIADVQNAIWQTLTGATSGSLSAEAAAMVAAGNANPGYIPGPGGVVAVSVYLNGIAAPTGMGIAQDVIIEIPTPACGSIGDYVWKDANNDGIQTPGEEGINGVAVTLTGAAGSCTIQTARKDDSDGYYRFSQLPAGSYTVSVATPTGLQPARTLQSGPEADSNLNPASVLLASRDSSDHTIDFGFYAPCTARIGDFVWKDLNNNGIQDAGEPGIAGAKLYMKNLAGEQIATTDTNAAGAYAFTGVCAGAYAVSVDAATLPENAVASPTGQGTPATDSDASGVAVIVGEGENNETIDFGYAERCSGVIGDFVWHDLNRNGIQDAGEPGLNNVTLKLMNGTTVAATAITQPGSTGAGGYYQFNGVCAGSYTITVATPAGFSPTTVNQGGADVDSDGSGVAVTVPGGGSNLSIDFGFTGACSGSIGDRVWKDSNRNGIQDSGEPGLGCFTVFLKKPDHTIIRSTTTNHEGEYSFGGLCTGSYLVEVKPKSGYASTITGAGTPATDSNPNPSTVVLPNDRTDDDTVDFGFHPSGISGVVWNDADKDGKLESGEAGLKGWTVTLTKPDHSTVNTSTGTGGAYAFTNLPAGTYKICVGSSCGWTQTYDLDFPATPNCYTVTLPAGEDKTDVNFGYYQPGKLNALVFLDDNEDGTQQRDEDGLQGWTVAVTGPGGYSKTVTTGYKGAITTIVDLLPGAYRVCVTPKSGYTQSAPRPLNNCTDVVVPAAGTGSAIFGYFKSASTPNAGSYVTYTQGGWGAKPAGNNPGKLLATYFDRIFGCSLSIGGKYKIKFSDSSNIRDFLPQGGTPGVLKANATNPASTAAGVFAGQVLALQLNVDFSDAKITPAGLGRLKIASGQLKGYTVAQVLELANAVLGGTTSALPSGLTVSGLNGIVDQINNNFDGGTSSDGFLVK